MARYEPATGLLAAAEQCRERCFRGETSVFSDDQLWTHENTLALERYCVENPQEEGDDFLTKLERQLAPASALAKELAAEMLCLLLMEDFMRPETKRAQVRRVWEWSGGRFPENVSPQILSPTSGVARPRTAYNTQRWREYRFFVLLLEQWTALPASKREELVADPRASATWMDMDTESEGRQFRDVLLYLLFPDFFERICSSDRKRRIVMAFRS